MVWRRAWLAAASIVAACGGVSVEAPSEGGAGEAGAAGEDSDGGVAFPSDVLVSIGGSGGGTTTPKGGATAPGGTGGSGAVTGSGAATPGAGGTATPGTDAGLPEGGSDSGDSPGSAAGATNTDPPISSGGTGTGTGTLPAPPAGCAIDSFVTTESLTPTDQCDAVYTCADGRSFNVTCDGENDGTGTSLCTCHRDQTSWHIGGVVPGESPLSCLRAAHKCRETWR